MLNDFSFAPETENKSRSEEQDWQILIADDEDEVHQVTAVALADLAFKGRNLRFLHAHSGAEARAILSRNRDIALVLLDVVMEADDSGLRLVRAPDSFGTRDAGRRTHHALRDDCDRNGRAADNVYRGPLGGRGVTEVENVVPDIALDEIGDTRQRYADQHDRLVMRHQTGAGDLALR